MGWLTGVRALGAMGAVGVLLAGCSSATAGQSSPTPSGGPGRGVSGTIQSVGGSTVQIQTTAGQSSAIITYGSTTKITDTVVGKLSDVKPGLCITVRSAAASSPPAAGQAAGQPAAGQPVAASSIALSQPTNGSCTAGFGGGSGGGQRSPGATPSFPPSADPSRSARAGMGTGMGMGAFGTVESVSGSTIVVATVGGAAGMGGAAGGQTPSPGHETVTTNAQTTVSMRADATASSLKVGRCVAATGPTDGAGVTAATSLAVSDPVGGTCPVTAGRGFGGNRG